MLRLTHRWPGLIAALLVIVVSLSGAALSVFPALDHLSAPQASADLTVAALTQQVAANHPGLEQIRRTPSGQIEAYWFKAGAPGAAVIDPATGKDAGSADPSRVELWLTDLHRSLFLGNAGRWVTAAGAVVMLVLTLSGAALVARRMGGWRRWFGPTRGPWPGRIHVELARFAVGGLVLSSLTALWLTALTFSMIPDDSALPSFASATPGGTALPVAQIPILASTKVSALEKLSLPSPSDPTDVYTLKTDGGTALVDPGTGKVLSSATPGIWTRISNIIMLLHTGRGASVLGLILGLMALSVPTLALTGVVQWLAQRGKASRIKGNTAAGSAETVVLVASEGGTSWGFARTLRDALKAQRQGVHVAPLSQFDPKRYSHAKRFIILAATYGEGAPPSAARGVIERIRALPAAPHAPLTILGFGDRSFPQFCGFAQDLARAAQDIGWPELLPLATVDRQSPQDFARWGHDLGAALGLPLELSHLPEVPRTEALRLIQRRDYGKAVGAPTAILRFALPPRSLWQRLTSQGFARFEAGDLLGIVPKGSTVPRFYSLASSRADGFIEICVRQHEGGLCSGQLTTMTSGESVAAFLRRNPDFRPAPGRAPVILIGAGTGIGPLAGFVRANHKRRPMHLFFGARTPTSDLLYDEELLNWQSAGQLATLTTAYSRQEPHHYVQDSLKINAGRILQLLTGGAQIMVCGGREMAAGVRETLAEMLSASGQSPATLKAEGRYAEDVY